MNEHRMLMISTDRKVFEEGSAVKKRMKGYAAMCSELHVIVFSKKEQNFSEIHEDNLHIYPTQSLSKFTYIIGALRRGYALTASFSPDASWISTQDPFETGLVGTVISVLRKIPLYVQVHTDLYSPYFAQHSLLNRVRVIVAGCIFKKANMIRVVSERIKLSLLARRIDESHITVEPIKVNTEKIRLAEVKPDLDLKKKYSRFSHIVLMASRLESEKNFPLALAAWKIVLEKFPQAVLVIVGDGSEKTNLEILAEELGIRQAVIFEGWNNDLASYYKSADVFLLTSLYEGYGMTLIEAQAAGVQIVSTDVGVAREVGARVVGMTESAVAQGIIEALEI